MTKSGIGTADTYCFLCERLNDASMYEIVDRFAYFDMCIRIGIKVFPARGLKECWIHPA